MRRRWMPRGLREYGGTQLDEAVGGRGEAQVGTANRIAEVQQHFRDTAHTDTADPREMEMLLVKKHFYIPLFRL